MQTPMLVVDLPQARQEVIVEGFPLRGRSSFALLELFCPFPKKRSARVRRVMVMV
jgi:hypothetical protein